MRCHNSLEDTIEEILLRLPVKSLVRYKSVCKKWLQLIESSAFIKAHFKLLKRKDRILVKYFDDMEGKQQNIVSCYDNYESMASPPQFTCRAHDDFDLTEFSSNGSMNFACTHCNGIVCLTDYTDSNPIVLLNPALREFKTVPPCQFRCPDLYSCSVTCRFVAFGFGFGFDDDDAINNFKVVRLMYRTDYSGIDISSTYYIEAQVYDLTMSCWRRSARIPIIIANSVIIPSPVLFKGILHCICWRATEEQFSDTCTILTFNISTELFEIMEFPSHWEDCYVKGKMDPSIFMMGDECTTTTTLALVAFTSPFQTYPLFPQITCVQLDVWVMKEYGVSESWTKQYSVMSPDSRVGMPISFWKKDKLLFITTDGKLICYDLPTGEQHQLRQYQFRPTEGTLYSDGAFIPIQIFEPLLYSFGAVIYHESLLSIKDL